MTSSVFIRVIRGCLVCLLLGAVGGSLRASEIEFVRIWPAWRETESFIRISEYFGGMENTGRQSVLRTHADARSGFYFLTRTANAGAAVSGAKFELKVILPDSPYPRIFIFPVDLPAKGHVFNLGLTGDDWPDKKIQPVAWRLRLLTADGTELAVGKSFLWDKPDGQ
ncbi:MAG: hypothetical protein KA257_05605 [Opitutaceae bacterium]|nr:hypothetical protein [Opitutaceae bacterium]MBP9914139.1 hypothetical protein [Opitutaceae bacterium]